MAMQADGGALAYLDEQIEALRTHTPAALEAFDPTGIHQARVATRRLKAGLDLLDDLVDPKPAATLAKAGKKLRRRLGPLRDLDVMIDNLKAFPTNDRIAPAIEWMTDQLRQHRDEARHRDHEKGVRSGKLLTQFEAWRPLRETLMEASDAIEPLLSTAMHEGFDKFSDIADWVCGISEPPKEHGPIDVHELRIDGKALRYTFEIAGAHGIKIPKDVFKTFKSMQESLGTWHDYVVLTEETMQRSVESLLAHHNPEMASQVLELAKLFLKQSTVALNQFRSRWRRSGEKIRTTLHERVPLTRDVSAAVASEPELNESKTDPDRPETGGTPAPDMPPSDVPPDA